MNMVLGASVRFGGKMRHSVHKRTPRLFRHLLLLCFGVVLGTVAQAEARAQVPVVQMAPLGDTIDVTVFVDTMSRHLRMTQPRPASAGDSLRAKAILDEMRSSLEVYKDPYKAIAAGYKLEPRITHDSVYHFGHHVYSMREIHSLNPRQPGSLLYKQHASGSLELIGAMFIAPENATTGDLDDRVPLGFAQWHRHVNWCMPKPGEQRRLSERTNGRPTFGPASSISTEYECESVGGRFYKALDPWMLHVYPWAPTLAESFNAEHQNRDIHTTASLAETAAAGLGSGEVVPFPSRASSFFVTRPVF